MKSESKAISHRRSSVGSVLVLAAIGTLVALEPTTAFHWVPSPAVPRLRWDQDRASRNHKAISVPAADRVAAAATTRGTQAKFKAVNGWPRRTKSVAHLPWRESLSKVKRYATAKATAMAAAAVLAFVILLSPLSAEAAQSGGRIGGSFPRCFDDDGVIRIASSRSDPWSLSPSLASAGLCHFRGGGLGRSPDASSEFQTNSAVIRRTSTTVASADKALSPGVAVCALIQLMCLGWLLYLLAVWSQPLSCWSALGRGTSVIQVTVAVRVSQRGDPSSILSVLHRLAGAAKARSQSNLEEMMSDVATELLRHKSSIVSAFAKSKHFRVRDRALREYGFLSVTERVKVQREEQPASPLSSLATSGHSTIAVVTLLLAIDGHMTRPRPIRSLASLEDALKKIAVDAKTQGCLLSADVLWTPSDPSEFLTAMDVMVDYPQLRSI